MKTTAIAIAILICSISIAGGEFLVCDPEPLAKSYNLTGPAWVPRTVQAQADGSLKMDIRSASDGYSAMTVKACEKPDGTVCGSSESIIIGTQTGLFKWGNGNVVWREWWLVGK